MHERLKILLDKKFLTVSSSELSISFFWKNWVNYRNFGRVYAGHFIGHIATLITTEWCFTSRYQSYPHLEYFSNE